MLLEHTLVQHIKVRSMSFAQGLNSARARGQWMAVVAGIVYAPCTHNSSTQYSTPHTRTIYFILYSLAFLPVGTRRSKACIMWMVISPPRACWTSTHMIR